ncbi:COG1470 family protein [Methanosarcina siciliae]|uniref:COG1470 family protein n=1 Tax=Methanosarcina siciliae TaxID=38027 RepID=UPI00164FDCF7|nr:NEW3 domain-containing protein [Methanosarcina siciliae]
MRCKILKIQNKVTALLSLLLFISVLVTFTCLATAKSIEIININEFNTGEFNDNEWLEENINLSANEKIELGSYAISYSLNFQENGTGFIKLVTFDKKVGFESSEKFYQLRSFSGSKEIRELKDKIIFLNSSIAISVNDTGLGKLKLKVWSKKDLFSEINMSTTAPEFLLISQGETVNIPLKINNNGCIGETVCLEASESEFYTHKFTYGDYRINKIKLDPKETKDVNIELRIDKDCTPGEYNFSVNASGRSSAVLIFPFIVEENSSKSIEKLAIQLSKIYVSGKSGSEIVIPVRIFNSGDVDLKDIGLDIKSPMDSWEIHVSEKKIDLIKSKEYETVDLTIRIPSETENGDYFVDLKGVADNVETEETKLRVNVKSQSNSAWIGIIIIVLVIAGLFFVFKKYGRR